MNRSVASISITALLLLSANAWAQKLNTVTHLELEYWRAFHGIIKLEVIRTEDNGLALNSTISSSEKSSKESKQRTVHIITERDLAAVLTLFNHPDARQFFADSKPLLQADGSELSISVTQNSLSLSFASQNAFRKIQSRYAAALGNIAQELFGLAKITIPKESLY